MKSNRLPLFILLLTLLLAACQPQEAAPAASTTSRPTVAEGVLQPRQFADLAFSAPGRVAEVLVSEGDAVGTGEVIARLELLNAEARKAELARAESEVLAAQQAVDALYDADAVAQRLAQIRFDLASLDQQIADRQQELKDEQEKDRFNVDDLLIARLEAQIDLLQAQSEALQTTLAELGEAGVDEDAVETAGVRLFAAQAAVAAAQAALQPVELKAPWAGEIASLDLTPGQSVSAGVPVATMADFSAWVVKTDNLTEIDVVGLQVGQTVELVLDALPDRPLSGAVASIRTKFEEKRGDITYTVTIAVGEVPVQARWGMTALIVLSK